MQNCKMKKSNILIFWFTPRHPAAINKYDEVDNDQSDLKLSVGHSTHYIPCKFYADDKMK